MASLRLTWTCIAVPVQTAYGATKQLEHIILLTEPPPLRERITLSSMVEQLCQRVSKLQYIVTAVTQVSLVYIKNSIHNTCFLLRLTKRPSEVDRPYQSFCPPVFNDTVVGIVNASNGSSQLPAYARKVDLQ